MSKLPGPALEEQNMLRMCVSHGAICGAKKGGRIGLEKERQSVKFSDTPEVTGKKCLGTTVTLWLTLAGLHPRTPCHMSQRTGPHPQPHFSSPTGNPDRIKTKGSPFHKLCEGNRSLSKSPCSLEVNVVI